MRWVRRAAAVLAGGQAALLACATPGSGCLDAPVGRLSPAPAQALLVDVDRGTVGGLAVRQSASAYVRRLGIPDYVGALETPNRVEMLWSHTASPSTGWATATLRGQSSTAVVELRFAGLFRTARGDRRGTALADFLSHWRQHGPVVTRVARGGALVEYNVVVGAVVFAFDTKRRLAAVGLAGREAERALCVIPAACVRVRIH